MKTLIFLLLLVSSLSSLASYKTEVLFEQKDVIWGFDFLSDGKIIFTERGGKLYVHDPKTKKNTVITGSPAVHAVGQGGLLDVRVHPKNGYVYLTYSEAVGKKASTTAVARAKLDGNKLTDFKKLFTAEHASENDHHYGSRVDFDTKGFMYISVGERGERDSVQKLSTHLGKVIRLHEDGSVPKDNPFVSDKSAKPEVYCYGLRNPQGLVVKPGTDEVWEAEMGPRGGDEINLIQPGKNYGWPVITYGREYYGPRIGEGTKKPGVEEPIVYWVPSISPSAITFYTGDKMPEWKGNIFLALLSGQAIQRVALDDKNKVTKQEVLLKDLDWRFRNVRTGPDGYLYFSTDEGKLGRVVAK